MHISCTICTELYQANEETIITKCGHLFHINCVKPWLQKNKTCPHCRSDSSINDVIRVFFTEISDENIHLNRNCKIDSLKAILASEKEHVHKIKMDLRQAENDLIDMNKHIERYENEIKNLKKLNDSLLENNDKIELENKKINEQSNFPACKKNHLSSESSEIEVEDVYGICNLDEDICIVELKTIIASYEEALKKSLKDNEILEKQLNIVIIRNEELELALHHIKDEKRKNEMIVLNENKAINECKLEETMNGSKEERGDKSKEERGDVNQKIKLTTELKPLKLKKRNESLNKSDVKRLDQYLKNLKKQQITNSKPLKPESTMPKQSKTESILSATDKFVSTSLRSLSDSVKKLEINTASSIHAQKGNKSIKQPMPPPRTLKPVPSLRPFNLPSLRPLHFPPPLHPIRAPFPPPRTRIGKPGSIGISSYSLPQTQPRKAVSEHPLTLNSITRSRSADPLTLLGLLINDRDGNINGPKETSIQNRKEEKSSTSNNESNA